MKQEVVQTGLADVMRAADELCAKLKNPPSEYSAVIFFASSSYDFAALSSELHGRFPAAEVIGASTAGEITKQGFTKNTIVLNALSDTRTKFKGVFIDDADKFPIVHKKEICAAAEKAGVSLASSQSHRDSFAIALICGLRNAEEATLALLYSLIADPEFVVAGGSAGDDLKFAATYVSYNGRCSNCASVVLFVKTSCRFEIIKENIFKKSGKSVMLTDVQPEKHLVKGIDGKNPRKRYAEVLGISEGQVGNALLDHPFGRAFGDTFFTASLVQFHADGTLSTYARVIQDSVQEILEPMDAVAITEKTCLSVKRKIPQPGCVILFNCILRTIGFEKKNQQERINSIWREHFPVYSGFSTYGEQFGHINSNQTLVAVVIGE